ncbi:MlaD family protein [Rhodococcus sp. Q]|uniref:MlaD family protein n=1 Tax=Rhodococcus sp. Q TaxID=2502252 RepID=UPI0010F4E398|nr:MlaD family protein [Rhodococcus sp. Q]
MSIRRPLIGLTLFLLVSFALTSTVVVTLQRTVQGPTTSYSALFTDASGLQEGDDVRMAGVRVGRVDAVTLDGTVARVAFRVEADQLLFGNTKASITYQNVIGQRYLGLSLGDFDDPRILEAGSEIPVERTEPSFDISALLNGFEPLFSVLDPEQVDNISSAVIAALQGDTGSVAALVAQTSSLAEALAGPDKVLGDVIVGLDTVVGSLAAQRGDLDSVITQSQAILTSLSTRRDQLTDQLTRIATVAGSVATLADSAQPEVDQVLGRNPGFADHFLAEKDSFGFFAFNLPPMLKGLARVSQEGSYLNTYLCNFNVTLLPGIGSVIPGVVAQATPAGHVTQSPICR